MARRRRDRNYNTRFVRNNQFAEGESMFKPSGDQAGRVLATMLATVAAVTAMPAGAADDLQDLLDGVSEEYARAYLAPFTYTFGPNLNSGIYHTAAIPLVGTSFDIGLKVMGTHLADGDESFQRVIENVDLGDYDPAFAGQTGDIILGGPTVFGNTDTPGTIAGYVDGVQVFSQEGIAGLVETTYAPMAVPQASIAGAAGLRATVRWLPEIELSEFGKTKLFGWGAQWTLNGVANTLPVDVMVGFFRQTLKVGTLLEADANSMFVAASKSFSSVTVYGGYAKEDSKLSVAYFYSTGGQNVAFSVDDTQESRWTVGATIDVFAKLNLEMAHGDLTTYTAGLMFGL
jgi:hypothetical protein